jgi:hypothetical protein
VGHFISADEDERNQPAAEFARIQTNLERLNNAAFAKALEPLRSGRRGKADAFGYVLVRHAAVFLENRQDILVDIIDHGSRLLST